MKRKRNSALIMLIAVIGLSVTAKAQIAIKTPEIEIGKVKQGEIRELSVIIANEGKSTEKITGMKTDCPCATFEGLPVQLMAGEERVIKIIFNSNNTGYIGEFSKTVLVSSTDKETPVQKFKMTGKIEK